MTSSAADAGAARSPASQELSGPEQQASSAVPVKTHSTVVADTTTVPQISERTTAPDTTTAHDTATAPDTRSATETLANDGGTLTSDRARTSEQGAHQQSESDETTSAWHATTFGETIETSLASSTGLSSGTEGASHASMVHSNHTTTTEAVHEQSSGGCSDAVRVVAFEARGTITEYEKPLTGWPMYRAQFETMVDTAEFVTLCPGETVGGCTLTEDRLLTWDCYLCSGFPQVAAGCSSAVSGDPRNLDIRGCCFEGDFGGSWELQTEVCDAAREGMNCELSEKCAIGHCRASDCVADEQRDCEDNGFCNGAEWCDPDVGCRPGFASAFDDDPCTLDSCDEQHDAISHAPVDSCADLCGQPAEVTVAEVTERTDGWPWSVPTIRPVELACGEQEGHCRRTEKGEWFVADERGDALSAPVSTGCAAYLSATPTSLAGIVYPTHTLRKCCVGRAPFEAGDVVGSSPIQVEAPAEELQ